MTRTPTADLPELPGLDHYLATLPAEPDVKPVLGEPETVHLLLRGLVGDVLDRSSRRALGLLSRADNSHQDVAAGQALEAIFSGQDARFLTVRGWHTGGGLAQQLRNQLTGHPQVPQAALATDELALQTCLTLLVLEVYQLIIDYDQMEDEAQARQQGEAIVEAYARLLLAPASN